MSDKPCKECPWSRTVEPGTLGGSPPEVYLGQVSLPFWLPCHCSRNYAGKASDVNEVEQCRGAAIFRSNIGVGDQMPDTLLHLPSDTENVFATEAEFYSHHSGFDLDIVEDGLTEDVKNIMRNFVCSDPSVRMQLKRKS